MGGHSSRDGLGAAGAGAGKLVEAVRAFAGMSLLRKCGLAGVSRSSMYHESAPADEGASSRASARADALALRLAVHQFDYGPALFMCRRSAASLPFRKARACAVVCSRWL